MYCQLTAIIRVCSLREELAAAQTDREGMDLAMREKDQQVRMSLQGSKVYPY